MNRKPRKPSPNPQPDVPRVSVGGDAYEVALALDASPRPSRTTEAALDSLPPRMREQARRQIAAFGSLTTGEDGWFNPETLMGVEGADPSTSTRYGIRGPWDFMTLEAIYRGEGIGRKVIDIPIAQMLRRTFEIKGESDGETVKYLKKKKIFPAVKALATNGSLFGGALAVMLVKDGVDDLEEPLDLKKVKSLEGLNVFDRWQCAWYTNALYRDPRHPKFMMPSKYQIFPIYGAPFWVHESRLLRWDGNFIPERSRQMNNGWMDSALQPLIDKFMMLGEAMGYSKAILRTMVVQVLALDGLADLVKGGNKKVVESRLRNLRKWLAIANIIPIDGKDQYQKHATSLAGLHDLLDRFMQWVAADGPVPYSILYGKMQGGLGNGKDDDVQLRMFYDGIRDEQNGQYTDVLARLCTVAKAAADYDGPRAEDGDQFEFDFPALTDPDEGEVAKTRLATAQADQIYLDAGVFSPEEIRQSRAGGDRYSPDYTAKGKAPRPPGVPEAVKPGGVGAVPGKKKVEEPNAAAAKKKPDPRTTA